MILPSTQIPFDKLAEEASSELFSKGVSLSDSVVKIAQREKLNPEEVKRLVEKANTCATLTMLKAASDKKAEIFLADPEEVLKSTHYAAEPSVEIEKTASSFFSIPNLRINDRIKDIKLHPGIDKTASMSTKLQGAKEAFVLTKKVEELNRKKLAEEIKVKDSLDYIISEFSKMRAPSFSKFAEEVYTIYGEPSIPVLRQISQITRDSLSTDLEKIATTIDDTSTMHKKYASINMGLINIIMLDDEITKTKQDLKTFWSGVNN